VHEAFKLGRQHHVSHHDAQPERKEQILEGFLHGVSGALVPGRVSRRQDLRRNTVQILHGLRQWLLFQTGIKHGRPLAIHPVDDAGAAALLNPDYAGQLDQAPVPGSHVEPSQIGRAGAIFGIEADADIVAPPFRLVLVLRDVHLAADQEVDGI